jgi:hypothetical protein
MNAPRASRRAKDSLEKAALRTLLPFWGVLGKDQGRRRRTRVIATAPAGALMWG